jgi:GxxExxY protein
MISIPFSSRNLSRSTSNTAPLKTISDSSNCRGKSASFLGRAIQSCAYSSAQDGLTFCLVTLPVIYDGVEIDVGYRIDLLVEDAVIVELKAVERLTPLSQAQLLSYLKLSGRKLDLLINFNVEHLKNGIKRIANGL